MFKSKLLTSSSYMMNYLKYSPIYKVFPPLQFCCLKTKSNNRNGLVERSSVIESRNTADRSVEGWKKNNLARIKSRQKNNSANISKKVQPLFTKKNPGVGRMLASVTDETNSDYFDSHDDDLVNLEEEFDSERDFFDANLDFDAAQSDESRHKHKLAYQIVKRKYFKPPVEPNLLTYAEKQHIRFLHEGESNNWSIETLSQSYPATPEIIKKLVRGKWKARSAAEIQRHDATVRRNWEALKSGDLEIHSQSLKEHLKQFSSRDIRVPASEEAEKFLEKTQKKPRRINEFSKIIESYQALKPPWVSKSTSLIGKSVFIEGPKETRKAESAYKHESSHSDFKGKCKSTETQSNSKSNSNDMHDFGQSAWSENEKTKSGDLQGNDYLNSPDLKKQIILETERTDHRAKHFTLDNFRERLERHSKWRPEISDSDKQIMKARQMKSKKSEAPNLYHEPIDEVEDDELTRLSSESCDDGSTNPLERSAVVKAKDSHSEIKYVKKVDDKLVMKPINTNVQEALMIDEYIKIPKHFRKQGTLFKVKDCFYADDGQFLYRVPGLKS